MRAAVMEIVQQSFRPEFINRIDDIVVFLIRWAPEQIRKIVDIQLVYLRKAATVGSATWTLCSTRVRGT